MKYEQALKLLDLNHNYTKKELRASYRAKSKKYHPDVNGGNENMFRLINEAYKFLDVGVNQNPSSGVVHNRPKQRVVYHGNSIFTYEVR